MDNISLSDLLEQRVGTTSRNCKRWMRIIGEGVLISVTQQREGFLNQIVEMMRMLGYLGTKRFNQGWNVHLMLMVLV